MCQLAAEPAGQFFDVDDLELFRQGPSYTTDTAADLLRRPGFGAVHWLIGADQLIDLPNWHRPLDLLQQVNFLIMARPGIDIDFTCLPPEFRHLKANLVRVPQIDISATEIRRRLRQGLPISFLTPAAVVDYIRENKLYRV